MLYYLSGNGEFPIKWKQSPVGHHISGLKYVFINSLSPFIFVHCVREIMFIHVS